MSAQSAAASLDRSRYRVKARGYRGSRWSKRKGVFRLQKYDMFINQSSAAEHRPTAHPRTKGPALWFFVSPSKACKRSTELHPGRGRVRYESSDPLLYAGQSCLLTMRIESLSLAQGPAPSCICAFRDLSQRPNAGISADSFSIERDGKTQPRLAVHAALDRQPNRH